MLKKIILKYYERKFYINNFKKRKKYDKLKHIVIFTSILKVRNTRIMKVI